MRVRDTAASQPQMTLPSARLACMAARFMDTARARTQAGAVLWVPAARLGSTLTQGAPAAQVPTNAIAAVPGEAMRRVAAIHRKKPEVTTAFSDSRCSRRAIDSA